MNAHNEQQAPASPVVKQNLTTQPAAAQEAVGWLWRWLDTDNTWSEWADGGSRKEIDARIACWKADGEDHRMQVRPVFAAPVTAAPADARSLALAVEQALGWRDGERDAELDSLLETAMSILDRTPAAPGIDQAIAAVESIQQYMRDDFQALPPEVFSLPQKAQRALVTLRGLADAPMRVHPRDAKEAVDYVVAHMLADSPKGGSEAINQLLPPNAWPQWADRHVWDANGEGWFYGAIVEGGGEGLAWNSELQPSGVAMPPEHDWRVPVLRTKPNITNAQAGDAEVQP